MYQKLEVIAYATKTLDHVRLVAREPGASAVFTSDFTFSRNKLTFDQALLVLWAETNFADLTLSYVYAGDDELSLHEALEKQYDVMVLALADTLPIFQDQAH